jgi:hypothetical protein
MTDADRVTLAVQRGTRMLGPTERQRCQRHPRRWELYRWTWRVGEDPTSGDAEIVRGCASCADEEPS